MSKVLQPGVFVLSIDVTQPRETTAARRSTTAACAVALTEHLAGLPATWALDLEANAALADELTTADAAHEIAVLADRSWAGPGLQRRHVADELRRRVLRAAAAGRPLSTLVLTDGQLTDNVDLLAKQGITAVRTIARASTAPSAKRYTPWFRRLRGARAAPAVRSLRWGLWEIGHAIDVIGSWRGVGRQGGEVVRTIDRVAVDGGLVHLSLDLGGLTGNVSTGLKLVDRIAVKADGLRAQGNIEVLTIARLAARLSRRPVNLPARSILRPAA
ncbi:MAG TPA: hypothetical protein VGX78_06990 [Pirellulales bacterium]|nr:hypothetical protein [Pirellulales bacterium]